MLHCTPELYAKLFANSNHPQDHDFSDDSDYSDASDHNKIFISLQDSVALRKLNFHKALGNGKFRLPKIRHNVPETYESLYKVCTGILMRCI